MSVKKHIPNILSTIRLCMAFSLPFVFVNTSLLTTIIFYAVGASTDAVDGFLARKWKVQSKYGKFVDPLADKMLNGLALLLTAIFVNPMLFILTGFEALIAGTNYLRYKNNKNISVSKIGKIKTVALVMTAILSLLASLAPAMALSSTIAIYLTLSLQTITLHNYIEEYYKHDMNKKNIKPLLEEKPNEDKVQKLECNKKDEIKKLKYIRNSVGILDAKRNTETLNAEANEDVFDEQEILEEDLGISRTLKK